tara:strand:- start:572 stop:2005 length:1434 start_codon:yes stop_codon:yes gene_type:complete
MNKNKFLFLSLGILFTIFLSLLISAQVTVNYNINESIFEEDNSTNRTNDSVNGAKVLAYNCLNANCDIISGDPFYSFNASSNSNIITVVYPTTLIGNGYALYVFKDGFIGWQQWAITYFGTGTVNEASPLYLSKKRTSFAPITNFSVYNEVEKNKPIEINISVGIDAETAAAIQDTRHVQNMPLLEDVETLVTLKIENSGGQTIYTDNVTLNIPYSEQKGFNFTYDGFNSTGNHKVLIQTNITDAKILNPIQTEAFFEINVIEQNLTNYSYSLLSNAGYSPLNPDVNDSVNVSLKHLSNFVNSTGGLNPLNTSLSVLITKDNVDYREFDFNLTGTSTTEYQLFSFDFLVNSTGEYIVKLIATPTPLMGNYTVGTNVSLSFSVLGDGTGGGGGNGEGGNGGGGSSGSSSSSSGGSGNIRNLGSFGDVPDSGSFKEIDLGGKITAEEKEKSSFLLVFLVFLILLILLLIAAIIIFLIKK